MSTHDDDRAAPGPDAPDATTVEALGSLSKALETAERARGHLYGFHQLTGTADFELDRAVRLLTEAGHHAWAERVEKEILGRDVMPGHWTYQIVDSYNETYYEPFRSLERAAVAALSGGREHRFEARLQRERRTPGGPGPVPAPQDDA
ncbi:hypothetical protein [Streptomyces filamentosus]|uniref:hypothetical protein n=1 Tax=Streptomyces filamentosus TaxID=67294 RepID=UPI00123961E8|nr:hypothetical protein [Streptomyces filamentosus]KAA6210806.1 hypothetical protein CP979_30370 [Streptomyces filamentosus]